MKHGPWLLLLALGCVVPRPKPVIAAVPEPRQVVVKRDATFEDSGSFTLFLNEEQIGESHFILRADGSYESQAKLHVAGQTLDLGVHVEASSGAWQRVTLVMPQGTVLVERHGDEALRSMNGGSTRFPLKAGARIFENYSPALLGYLVRAYDAKRGGSQSFPVFIAPIEPADVIVERNGTTERIVDGALLQLTEYTFELRGIELKVLTDAAGHVERVHVPSQRATFVRQGAEALAAAQVNDDGLSRAQNTVEVQKNTPVPMRDGLGLATDLYRPKGVKRAPVILFRTPYQKEKLELSARFYARRGYVVAVQDVRGRFASKGVWEPFLHEGKDGFDTVEWLGTQPWSTGKVGIQGASYGAWVGWWALAEHPPHLAAMVSNVSPPDPMLDMPYEHGCFALLGSLWWSALLDANTTADVTGERMRRTYRGLSYGTLLGALPVAQLDERVLGHPSPLWKTWIDHPTQDAYWDSVSFLAPEKLKGVNVPVFHQSGWFDGDGIGTKLNYLAMVKAGAKNQKLLIGPWADSEVATRRAGTLDFGPDALVDLPREYLRWFDHHLKGAKNGIDTEPAVTLFLMGANAWVTGDHYPLKETRTERWYLQSGGKAQTSLGDGVLARTQSKSGSRPDRYVYDPVDPTPSPDFIGDETPAPGTERSAAVLQSEHEGHHAAITSTRRDILVYTSPPFTERYTVVGPLSATLQAASSAVDTDWFVSVLDEAPGGTLLPLATGKLRARYRNSLRAPEPLKPGRVYPYSLDLWHTGISLERGHRLRVEVSSALFPVYARNLNTGGHNEADSGVERAMQTVHHDGALASFLEVQVLPADSGTPRP